jgi:putative transposase
MAEKHYKPEEIVAKLRQVDVLISQGQNIADAIRQIGVSEVTYYRWRREFGGMRIEQVKRLQNLERENIRLRNAVSALTLDRLILQEVRAQLHSPSIAPVRRRATPKPKAGAIPRLSVVPSWQLPTDSPYGLEHKQLRLLNIAESAWTSAKSAVDHA